MCITSLSIHGPTCCPHCSTWHCYLGLTFGLSTAVSKSQRQTTLSFRSISVLQLAALFSLQSTTAPIRTRNPSPATSSNSITWVFCSASSEPAYRPPTLGYTAIHTCKRGTLHLLSPALLSHFTTFCIMMSMDHELLHKGTSCSVHNFN